MLDRWNKSFPLILTESERNNNRFLVLEVEKKHSKFTSERMVGFVWLFIAVS